MSQSFSKRDGIQFQHVASDIIILTFYNKIILIEAELSITNVTTNKYVISSGK